jgi:hypothetical protein
MSSELKNFTFFLVIGIVIAIGSIFLYFYGNYRINLALKKVEIYLNC